MKLADKSEKRTCSQISLSGFEINFEGRTGVKHQAAEVLLRLPAYWHYTTDLNDVLLVLTGLTTEKQNVARCGTEKSHRVYEPLKLTLPGHFTVSALVTALTPPAVPTAVEYLAKNVKDLFNCLFASTVDHWDPNAPTTVTDP